MPTNNEEEVQLKSLIQHKANAPYLVYHKIYNQLFIFDDNKHPDDFPIYIMDSTLKIKLAHSSFADNNSIELLQLLGLYRYSLLDLGINEKTGSIFCLLLVKHGEYCLIEFDNKGKFVSWGKFSATSFKLIDQFTVDSNNNCVLIPISEDNRIFRVSLNSDNNNWFTDTNVCNINADNDAIPFDSSIFNNNNNTYITQCNNPFSSLFGNNFNNDRQFNFDNVSTNNFNNFAMVPLQRNKMI